MIHPMQGLANHDFSRLIVERLNSISPSHPIIVSRSSMIFDHGIIWISVPNILDGITPHTPKKNIASILNSIESQPLLPSFSWLKPPHLKKKNGWLTHLETSFAIADFSQGAEAGITLLLLTRTDRVMASRQWAFPQSTKFGSTVTMGPMVLAIKIKFPGKPWLLPCHTMPKIDKGGLYYQKWTGKLYIFPWPSGSSWGMDGRIWANHFLRNKLAGCQKQFR